MMPGAPHLDDALADRFAAIALAHVTREYPHALSHVMDGPQDAASPRALHPVFYGSFDWHSCVHGYWMLATLLRRFPGMTHAAAIRGVFDAHLAAGPVQGECDYFSRPSARGFERPYGWAWVLALQHALVGTAWEAALRPLAEVVAARFAAYLPKATYPVRVGTHYNTAFALVIASPYAAALDQALLALMQAKAQDWYGADAACQAWEPSQDDFLSSALIEALCMLRLAPAAFGPWFDRFLPDLAQQAPATLFAPARVSDRSDGKIAHLDGLNLSRAWCWRRIATALPPGDARRGVATAAADAHLDLSLPHVAGDYMGEHWLASFAVLAMLDGTAAP
jgi:hypothetical protein